MKTTVRVRVLNNDGYILAMVRGLAWKHGGDVRGATEDLLSANGYVEFPFRISFRAQEFCDRVAKYLPGMYVTAEIVTAVLREGDLATVSS